MNTTIPDLKNPRQRLSWDQLWMRIAETLALRSADPQTQVGCVLVSPKNKIINTGYNGLPSGVPETVVDWSDRPSVRKRVLHAEVNCVVHAMSRFEEATLYTTLSPCSECLKVVAASGIKSVVYKESFRDIEEVSALASEFNITLRQFKESIDGQDDAV